MPELPEVETIRRGLNINIIGKMIVGVDIRTPRLRFAIPFERLNTLLPGCEIRETSRRSKYLVFHLENQQFLIFHLGMSGRLLWLPQDTPLEKHDHFRIFFPDQMELRYRDPRRFGMIDITQTLGDYKYFNNLGVEPLSPDCTWSYLYARSRKSKKPIKNFIMDAQIVVGVGNIYANEDLFLSGIRPQKRSGSLSKQQWKDLTQAIKTVLRSAIRQGGTTINDFQNSLGEAGYFQLYLRIYGRAGEPCKKCKTIIKKIVLSGRSSFYCPKCQN